MKLMVASSRLAKLLENSVTHSVGRVAPTGWRTRASGARRSSNRMPRSEAAMRASSVIPGSGGEAGTMASQLRSTRWSGSWASRCWSRVVPLRGSPMMTTGGARSWSRMAGVADHVAWSRVGW